MSLPGNIIDREHQKFTEDINGDVAVRVEASMIQGDATSIQGVPVNNTPPSDGDQLVYNSSTEQWRPTSASSLGWVLVQDNTYTSESPFGVDSSTRTKIEINKDSTITTYSPTNDASWWDESNNKFAPDTLGAYWEVRLSMSINPNQSNRNFTLELDIGGSEGVIFTDEFRMTSGSGDFFKSFIIPIFSLSTFISNGGEFYVTSNTGLDIYDLSITIFKQWAP